MTFLLNDAYMLANYITFACRINNFYKFSKYYNDNATQLRAVQNAVCTALAFERMSCAFYHY